MNTIRTYLLILLVILAGCIPPQVRVLIMVEVGRSVPGWTNTLQFCQDEDRCYSNYEVSIAMGVFFWHYTRKFPHIDKRRLRKELEALVVYFRKDDWILDGTGTTLKGTELEDPLISGLARQGMIEVSARDGRLSNSSFIHELIHTAIRVEQGNSGDWDHEGTKDKGWTSSHTNLIRVINAELFRLGI